MSAVTVSTAPRTNTKTMGLIIIAYTTSPRDTGLHAINVKRMDTLFAIRKPLSLRMTWGIGAVLWVVY